LEYYVKVRRGKSYHEYDYLQNSGDQVESFPECEVLCLLVFISESGIRDVVCPAVAMERNHGVLREMSIGVPDYYEDDANIPMSVLPVSERTLGRSVYDLSTDF
jgi:hypothetical protein